MDKFFLKKDETALVIVDIQERLASVMSKRQKVIINCLHLIEVSKILDIPVIITEQYPKGLGLTVREIRDSLSSYKPLEKLTFNCCGEPLFIEALSVATKKKIVLVGMETHICVLQTCLGLLKEGYHVHLVKDAVCSRVKDNFETGVMLMRDAGAVITSTETVLFQLLERAGTEEFRMISKRIK